MSKREQKQFNFVLPPALFEELKAVAKERGTTITDVIRHSIKWELMTHKLYKDGGKVLLERGNGDRPVEVLSL